MNISYDMVIYSFRKKIEYLFQISYNTFEIYKNKGNELVLIKDENMGMIRLPSKDISGKMQIYVFLADDKYTTYTKVGNQTYNYINYTMTGELEYFLN